MMNKHYKDLKLYSFKDVLMKLYSFDTQSFILRLLRQRETRSFSYTVLEHFGTFVYFYRWPVSLNVPK